MRLTYCGAGRFQEDEEAVDPGESFDVSDERAGELLARFPEELERSSKPAAVPLSTAEPSTGIAPSAASPGD